MNLPGYISKLAIPAITSIQCSDYASPTITSGYSNILTSLGAITTSSCIISYKSDTLRMFNVLNLSPSESFVRTDIISVPHFKIRLQIKLVKFDSSSISSSELDFLIGGVSSTVTISAMVSSNDLCGSGSNDTEFLITSEFSHTDTSTPLVNNYLL